MRSTISSPLVDALNKSLADMMVTSEYVGRPRRWATGIELTENPVIGDDGQPTDELVDVNPIPEGARAMISENDQAKFGQLQAADLSGYEASVRVILGQIMAVSTLPAHYVGVFTDNPASADALRAAEASLTARAEARQAIFGRAWEQVARLDGRRSRWPRPQPDRRHTSAVGRRRDPQCGPGGRRRGQAVPAGLLPTSYALSKLGYSDDEIVAIRPVRAQDTTQTADVTPLAS